MQLFISHSGKDRAWVEPVQRRIEEQGFHAYLAEYDLQPGVSLNGKIQQAIAASDAVVVVLTDNAAASPIVRDEIGYSLGIGKPVVPLVAPSVAVSIVSLGMLSGLEYVPFDIDNPQDGLLKLTDWVHKFAHIQQVTVQRAEMAELGAQVMELRQKADAQSVELNLLRGQNDAAMMLLVFVGAVAAVALIAAATSQ